MNNLIKNTILDQKFYKDAFLDNLKSSKVLFSERSEMANKGKYLSYPLVKVVLGPRRAGKSVFLFQLLQDQNFAYFNFDEITLDLSQINFREFTKILHEVYGDFKCIYFDEIQNVPKWEIYLNQLHREGYNVFVTGSNANLLSGELATHLTGRHLPIEIFPFSLHEYSKFYDSKLDQQKLEKFLFHGGFPEIVALGLDSKSYLQVLYDSTIFKDLLSRHNVRHAKKLAAIGQYFLDNVSSLYNATKLANKVGFKSDITLEKYFQYFTDTYLLFSLERYSFKSTERINSPRKVYTVDNGFIQTVGIRHSEDRGKFFENLVFTELLKKGYVANKTFFYFKTKNNYEVDFLLKEKSQIVELVQVAYDLNNKETEDREIRGLFDATKDIDGAKLTIITWAEDREIEYKGHVIRVVSFEKYFMK